MESPPIRLLKRAANTDLPLAALAAVVELRRALDGWEAEAVRRARDGGASWQDIAEVLAVTRQAAQQRYGSSGRREGPGDEVQPG